MVTAKGTEIDTVVALEVGADDYVTKPYRLRELVARMRAVLRRTPGGTEASDTTGSIEFGTDGIWESNGIKVDFDQRRVFVRGEEVHLRRKEFELLRLLVENSGRVLTRDVLIDRVLGNRLHRRHQDARRAHQAVALSHRGRPFDAGADHHRARRGLPLRGCRALRPRRHRGQRVNRSKSAGTVTPESDATSTCSPRWVRISCTS